MFLSRFVRALATMYIMVIPQVTIYAICGIISWKVPVCIGICWFFNGYFFSQVCMISFGFPFNKFLLRR